MKVYRFVHKLELAKMLDADYSNLGSECYNFDLSNSHKYHEGKKYLHFFYNKQACQHIIDDVLFDKLTIDDNNVVKDYYICTFNIPIKHLLLRTRTGTYKSLEHFANNQNQT